MVFSFIFGFNPALSRLLHSGDSGPQTSMEGSIIENHDLRRHILLVETINMKEMCTILLLLFLFTFDVVSMRGMTR